MCMLCFVCSVGQNRVCTLYMTVYLVISLPNHRKYTVYIWSWPNLVMWYPSGFIYMRLAGSGAAH